LESKLQIRRKNVVTNKKFGFFCGWVLLLLGLYQVAFNYSSYLWPFLIAFAILTLTLAHYKSSIFNALNQGWFHVGRIMASVMNPLILGAIYFLVITPIAIVTKIFGRDELRIKKRSISSYWLIKNRSQKNPQSMENQF
jgi:hypothetical protein